MHIQYRKDGGTVRARGRRLGAPLDPAEAWAEVADEYEALWLVPGEKRVVLGDDGSVVDIAVDPPPPEPPPDPQVAQDRADLPALLSAVNDDRLLLADETQALTQLQLRRMLRRTDALALLLARYVRKLAGL